MRRLSRRGRLSSFLDGDDALRPWALEAYSRIIDLKQPKIVLGQVLESIPHVEEMAMPEEIGVVDYGFFLKKDRTFQASASAIVISQETFQDVKGWSAGMFPSDDIDLLLKLANSGRTIQIVSPPTVFYRMHAANAVHQVPRFIGKVHKLIQKVRSSEYPCGLSHRFEMYALVGGPVANCMKKAYRAGLYREAWGLMADGWLAILVATTRRLAVRIKGTRPIETIELKQSRPTVLTNPPSFVGGDHDAMRR